MYTNTSKKDKDSTQNPAKAVRRRTRHTAHSTRHQSLRSGTEITAKARRSLSRRKTNAPKLSLRGISVRPRTLSYRNACPKPGKPDSGIHHLFPAHPPQKTLDRILHQAADRHRPDAARHGGHPAYRPDNAPDTAGRRQKPCTALRRPFRRAAPENRETAIPAPSRCRPCGL